MKINQWLGKVKQHFQENPFDALLLLGFIIVVIILVRLNSSVNPDDAHWEQFKVEHDCQLRRTKTGTQRSSWACNDGKTYFRWRQQR